MSASKSKKETLADFLSQYEKVMRVGSGSFAAYLTRNGINPNATYDQALKDARSTYERSISEYGTRAERLGRAGLTGSGYSDYLSGLAYSTYQGARERAGESRTDLMRESAGDYAGYIADLGEQNRKTLNALQTQGISDYDTAYAYAVSTGLDGDAAKMMATLVSSLGVKSKNTATVKQRTTILSHIIKLNLPRDAAYIYALSCGVGEDVAAAIADSSAIALGKDPNKDYEVFY